MNLNRMTPSPCILDRLRLRKVLDLLSHVLLDQEGNRLPLFQQIHFERPSEVGERL